VLEEQLVHQAFHDPLTNLPNRALFHGRTADALERARPGAEVGLGVRLALDDFGTGYSSLSNLQRFPIDILKIDMAFVDHVTDSDESHALVEAIIGLAAAPRVETLAEGIEQPEQHRVLQQLGCRYGQGYLFGRVLDEPAVQLFLRAHATEVHTPRLGRAAGVRALRSVDRLALSPAGYGCQTLSTSRVGKMPLTTIRAELLLKKPCFTPARA
jgi:hypothetical protein